MVKQRSATLIFISGESPAPMNINASVSVSILWSR